ncbi:hypothetical protein EMIHUDRAFT_447872 [Emiliania huxleyi CCMP1516]|uniref:Uncharacterized protein n=2 Tax=Emiliania huxleyi TaxID=2903 RepID=A0A0D3JI66_EMIH1|nr:hypothetical protein EMIHUDRAFT_447872 [Emiliania huxleyi CCMP1516]EOD23201.1 hypothetical protein EMIHUDRAFT_447872 [Emiliania huxleyi CCMP1516]|eukprot:XP_005775630.1 hypothetical protein EMIHUDRAFT_447872 [Emiliania huxleyi CCMP1516]
MGLAREDSHSGYRAALLDDLRRVPRGDSVVLKFGQVDCDFVYYLKLVHDASLTFEAHLARSVERYFAFIDGALAAGHLRHEERQRLRRPDLYIATPFPTGVVDAHLREALCSLPLMAKAEREAFRRALDDHLFLPTEAERCVGANHHLPPAAEPFAAAALARHCLGRSDGDAEPPPGDPAGALADPAGGGEALLGAAPLRARGHVLASWRHLAALLGAPAALGREFATQGPHHAQWVVRLLRGCDAPVAVGARGPGAGEFSRLTVPQLMRTPVAGALVAAARQAQEARGEG